MIFSTQMDFLTPKTPKLTYYTEYIEVVINVQYPF